MSAPFPGLSWCVLFTWYIFQKEEWNALAFNPGILKGEVSLYQWPPVWLVWNQLYDNRQFLFLLQNRRSQTSQTGQLYSDTSLFSTSCSHVDVYMWCLSIEPHDRMCKCPLTKYFFPLIAKLVWSPQAFSGATDRPEYDVWGSGLLKWAKIVSVL
jgi:hypothetical protein